MTLSTGEIEIFLILAALVSILSRRLHVPISVGLVLAGIFLTFFHYTAKIVLTKDLIFNVFLPPLVFEAAFNLQWREVKRDLGLILVLATGGVMVSAGVTAIGVHYLLHWEWVGAIVFGSLIAATDPVSVVSVFKESNFRGRLRTLVEAESLFNDVTAVVAFGLALSLIQSLSVDVLHLSASLVTISAGSLFCGFAVSGLVLLISGRTDDHLVESLLTFIGAFGSFIMAEELHFSGVLACVVAGLVIGNTGKLSTLSPRGRESLDAVWEYIVFVANSLIFILIGYREAHENFLTGWGSIVTGIGIVLISRAAAIYPLCALFSRSPSRVEPVYQHLLFWGGLRGALALALVLGLPPELPHVHEIVTVSFAVVAFSIFVQGLTIIPLLRRMENNLS